MRKCCVNVSSLVSLRKIVAVRYPLPGSLYFLSTPKPWHLSLVMGPSAQFDIPLLDAHRHERVDGGRYFAESPVIESKGDILAVAQQKSALPLFRFGTGLFSIIKFARG